MQTSPTNPIQLPLDLGDGLILRRSTAADAVPLAEFNAMVHSDEGIEKPDEKVWAWSYDLMAKPHPTFRTSDFTIVEDTQKGKIVSTMNLIPQTWTYAGIPFKVGRPELVGTLPDYRNRGLVRRQFEVIHQWSRENGDKVQAITGIPYYYRLFGYEMAMNLHGGRAGFPTHIPRLPDGEAEPFTFRPAVEADIPFLSELYNLGCSRSLVACLRDAAVWKDELSGKSDKNVQRQKIMVIETTTGDQAGYLTHPYFTWGDAMPITLFEVMAGIQWREATISVIRYAEKAYEQYQPDRGTKKPFGAYGLWFGEDHPSYHVIPDILPRVRKPYAWYLRVPDIADFLKLITPVLEKRLFESYMAGYTGEVKLTFYQDGVRMVFNKGRLGEIEAWQPTPVGHSGDAAFPPHTFLQLLFGYRTIDMVKANYPDCWTDRDEVHVLLSVLFPHQPSDVWPVS